MLTFQNLKTIIAKNFYRILLFFVFYHGLIKPLQIRIADKIVKPLIEKITTYEQYYYLKANKHHLTILHESDESIKLHFSIPFGQAYFFKHQQIKHPIVKFRFRCRKHCTTKITSVRQ